MKEVAIKAESISKCYRIGLKEELHDNIASAIYDFIKSPWTNYRKYRALYRFEDISLDSNSESDINAADIIWALKNISFNVRRGEALGIIGRNGAGKSTLLKILSRITAPTKGRAEIYGRISSLLEVGTGFHPELTGRDNVYLNGTVLGMTKQEVDRKFDEIVDFSGVERFIDTPVKRYSSGMKVRLAFAVAAHLEPEIFMVDEVLAVGDAEFQRKCLGKMGKVSDEGRTVLFVSHNMGAITELCERTLWLENAEVRLDGVSSEVVAAYLSSKENNFCRWTNLDTSPEDATAQIKTVRLLSENNEETSIANYDADYKVEIGYELIEPLRNVSVLCRLTNPQGYTIWTSWDTDSTDWNGRLRESGRYLSICNVPAKLLKPGFYYLSVGLKVDRNTVVFHEYVLSLEISQVGYRLNPDRHGIITPLLDWDIKRIDESY